MKKIHMLPIIVGMVFCSIASADNASLLLKANGIYEFASSAGYRTNSLGFGATVEKHIGYSQMSFLLTFDYLMRIDDVDYVPVFDDVYYFSLGGRQYVSYGKPLTGPYAGLNMGVGIPRNRGVYWDVTFLLGYQVVSGRIAVDLNAGIGYGVLQWREDWPYGSVYLWYDGFVFKPSFSIGVSL